MPLFSDLKKLLFGVKALGKSASEKIGNKKSQTWEDARPEFTQSNTGEVNTPTPDTEKNATPINPIGNKVDDTIKETLEKVEEIKENSYRKGAELLHNAGEAAERIIQKAEETKEKITKQTDRFWEQADEATDKMVEKTDKFWQMAEEKGEALGDKLKSMANKGEQWLDDFSKKVEEELAEENEKRNREKENPHAKAYGSTLDGKDSFFEKARKFAEGKGESKDPGGMKIIIDDEAPKKPAKGKLPGFEDRDGDGNELIDDAIIDNDDPEKQPE